MQLGFVKFLTNGGKNSSIDIIPVDHTSNMILCALASMAIAPKGTCEVFHSASSHLKPCTYQHVIDGVNLYVRNYPSHRQARSPGVMGIQNKNVYEILTFATNELPVYLLKYVSSLPVVGDPKKKQQAE